MSKVDQLWEAYEAIKGRRFRMMGRGITGGPGYDAVYRAEQRAWTRYARARDKAQKGV